MFSKTCTYSIRAVLFLAAHSTSEKKIGVNEMAASLNMPRHFLAKILQYLSKNNFISSLKGPSGGFYLSENQRKGALISVIEQMDGKDFMSKCVFGLPECSSEFPCPIHDKVEIYRKELLTLINDLTIDKIAKKVRKGKIRI